MTAFKRRIARLPPLTVPKVASDAVGFKKPFAEAVIVILGSRLFGICFIDWGERHSIAGRAGLRLDRPQIANERLGVGGRQVFEAVGDRFAHRARSRTTAFGVSGLEIIENLTVRPGADPKVRIRRNVVCVSSVNHGAGKLTTQVHREGDVARRVAFTTMPECRG